MFSLTKRQDNLVDSVISGDVKLHKKPLNEKQIRDRIIYLQEQISQFEKEKQKLQEKLNGK